MNREELIEKIAQETGETKAATERFLASFIGHVQKAVAEGDRVALLGFGTFESSETAARTGRNPSTGEAMQIPAKRRVKFKAGKQFADKVSAG